MAYSDITVYDGDIVTGYRLQCDPVNEIVRLRTALEKIRDHEHCKFPDCEDQYKMTETELRGFGDYLSGCAHGHRCCAAIAREALEGKCPE
jgi:hypothetical protein